MYFRRLEKKIDKLIEKMEKSNIMEISNILGSKKEIIKRNLLAGIFKGIGVGIGITIISAMIIYALQKIILLNIPLIGDYITDIVEIVQKNI